MTYRCRNLYGTISEERSGLQITAWLLNELR